MDLKNILSEIENRGLTGYEIAKNTSLTEAGINKILKGETKPRKTTIDVLNNYISSLATDKDNVISKNKRQPQKRHKVRFTILYEACNYCFLGNCSYICCTESFWCYRVII